MVAHSSRNVGERRRQAEQAEFELIGWTGPSPIDGRSASLPLPASSRPHCRAFKWDDSKTLKRYDVIMPAAKRSTIYFDPAIHRALRLKAAAMDVSISDIVNEAVKQTLSEDAADLEVFEKRRREPTVDFEDVVRAMKRSGKL
jgi:hypothetical protein